MTLEDLRRGLSDLPQMRGLPLGLWFSWETSGDSVTTFVVISVSIHIFKIACQVMHCSGLLWSTLPSCPFHDRHEPYDAREMECHGFWNCPPHAHHLKFLNYIVDCFRLWSTQECCSIDGWFGSQPGAAFVGFRIHDVKSVPRHSGPRMDSFVLQKVWLCPFFWCSADTHLGWYLLHNDLHLCQQM